MPRQSNFADLSAKFLQKQATKTSSDGKKLVKNNGFWKFFDERSEQARVLAPVALPFGDEGDALLAKNPALAEEGKNPFSLDSKEPNWERSALPLCLSKELPRLDYRLRPSRLGIAQASFTLLSLLRPFLLGEVRYLSVKKAYPNEAQELHSRACSPTLSPRPRREDPKDYRVSYGGYLAQLRYKSYVRKTQENWEN